MVQCKIIYPQKLINIDKYRPVYKNVILHIKDGISEENLISKLETKDLKMSLKDTNHTLHKKTIIRFAILRDPF